MAKSGRRVSSAAPETIRLPPFPLGRAAAARFAYRRFDRTGVGFFPRLRRFQVVVEALRLRRRAAAGAQIHHPGDADVGSFGEGQHVADVQPKMGFFDHRLVDAKLPRRAEFGRQRPAFEKPGIPQPFIQALAIQCQWPARCCSLAKGESWAAAGFFLDLGL